MSKVLVDRELLEKWTDKLEGADSEGYGWEDLLAAEIRGAIAQPVEAEGVSNARLMNTLAELARRAPLRTLHTICETQRQVSTVKLERYLEPIGDTLAGYAFTLRIDFDKLSAALSAVTAERDRLREALGDKALCAAYAERQKLLAEVESMRKVIRAALYYVPEHKHDLREIMSAAMAAKEA